MDPSARKINSAKFQFKKVSVLIVTDVAARGIDIPSLDYVINVHFPGKPKLFVHRVGKSIIRGINQTNVTRIGLVIVRNVKTFIHRTFRRRLS